MASRRSTRSADAAGAFRLRAKQAARVGQNERLSRLNAELESARDGFADLFELAPVPYLIATETGIIEQVNQLAAELLRRGRHELEGRPLALLIEPARRAEFRRFMVACYRRGPGHPLETELYFEPPVHVRVMARPTQGRRVYLALVDLTERRRTRAERNTLVARAESAESAMGAKDRFLAMLSHELRTPLSPVVAALSALRRGPCPRTPTGGWG